MSKHEEYQYLSILEKLLKEGAKSGDRTGTGTYKLWGQSMDFSLDKNILPVITTKKLAIRLVIEELLWFLKGSTDVKRLQEKNVKIWNGNGSKQECEKFGREEADLGPIYGHQWRNFNATKREVPLKEDYWSKENKRWVNRSYKDNGVDQIKYVLDQIQNNPNSRRILFSGWHAQEAHLVNPPPCHTLYQFQVCEGKLNSLLLQRSGDFFLGVAFNLTSLSLLTHLLAHLTGLKAGRVVHTIGDCHLYSDHVEQAKIQISREPLPFPTIKINKDLEGKGFEALEHLDLKDFEILDYKSHPPIKAKMSV